MNKCHWKNGGNRLAQLRVVANLYFVKTSASLKCNKTEHNKTRSACILLSSTTFSNGSPKVINYYSQNLNVGLPDFRGHVLSHVPGIETGQEKIFT